MALAVLVARVVVAAGVVWRSASASAAAPSLTALGDLPGGVVSSQAIGISADGLVVVGESNSASGPEAFRWTAGGGMTGLGILPGGLFFYSYAADVSDDGSIIVGRTSDRAFRWTEGGGMVLLGALPGGGTDGAALGVSGDGSTIVGYAGSASGTQAFRWTAGGGMIGLSDLSGGTFQSTAYGISDDNSTIVGAGVSDSGTEAFRWTVGEGMVPLGDLPGGGFQSIAYAISGDGSTIVGQGWSASGLEAFRWTAGGGMIGLGELPGGLHSSLAYDVSADGSVIVGRGNSAAGFEALRWSAGGGMERLWDVLLASGINPAADGWTILSEATALSADGNTIVGFGTRNGNTEAFVAIVPEPVALSLCALGGPALVRRRSPTRR